MRARSLWFLLCGSIGFFASPAHAVPSHLWSHSYGNYLKQTLQACVADPSGNTVMCGTFNGTINITTLFTAPYDHPDAVLAKFDPSGNALWSIQIGTLNGDDTARSAACDLVGNIVLAGSQKPQGGTNRPYIAGYSSAGVQQWLTLFASSSPDSQAAIDDIDTGPDNHIFVVGRFRGTVNLGGATLVASSRNDLFVGEFDAAGGHVWSKSFTTASDADTTLDGFGDNSRIAVDPLGQPVVFGLFGGSADFGGGPVTAPDNVPYFFLAKFNHNGGHMWSGNFPGGPLLGRMKYDLDVDPSARIAVTGTLRSATNFGGGVLTPVGESDIFLAMFNTNGSHLWSKQFGGVSNESGLAVAFASNNDVLLSADGGGEIGTFTFGGGTVNTPNGFIARFFVASGDHRWSQPYFEVKATSIGETNGDVFIGGSFLGWIDLGGGFLMNNGVYEDIFVARFRDHLTAAGPTLARASLQQNVPNPFNPQTRIAYTLTSSTRTVIEIIDATGAVVTRLDEGTKPAGTYSTTWNGRDAKGNALASGVYFYRLAGLPDVGAKKMVLLK